MPGSYSVTGDVLVTWPSFPAHDPLVGGRLTAAGLGLRLAPKLGYRSASELAGLVDGAVAAIVSTDPFTAPVLGAASALRVIARVGVGTDSIDLVAAKRCRVAVTTTPGANEATVADHTVALMLAALRRVGEHDASVRRGEWNRMGPITPFDVSGITVGIVGFGSIGRRVAQRLAGFDVDLLACDVVAMSAPGVRFVSLEELLACSDVVSLHVPLTSTTRRLIEAARLAAMKPQAVLVNTSRGELVDEAALVEALRRGSLRAAALDVFESEPPTGSALLDMPNVVLSPHVGGLSPSSVRTMLQTAVDSVLAVLENRPVRDVAVLGASGSGEDL